METLLLVSVFLPAVAALLLAGSRETVRWCALGVTVLVLLMVGALIWQYPAGDEAFASTEVPWLGGSEVDVSFDVAIDGLSLWLFGLTALLMVTAVLVSWEAIKQQATLYYRLLLLLETGMLGVFVARDIILFYVFFEFTLIPLFFLIGVWGSEERRRAAIKFFLFTLAGSVLAFLGLLSIVLWNSGRLGPSSAWTDPAGRQMTFSIPRLTEELATKHSDLLQEIDRDGNGTLSLSEFVVGREFGKRGAQAKALFEQLDEDGNRRLTLQEFRAMDSNVQLWIFLALFAGFAIKVPLFPLHTWLPLAHVQAPTAGSVILAGVLLKIGTYGFVRFSLPMLPDAVVVCMPYMLWLAVAGIIYGALVALAQSDIKRLIAYSSVSHLGFCMLGIFAANPLGIQGGTLQMINHGLSTGGLFALVGMLYERYHTRKIADLGGLAKEVPLLTFFMLVMTLSSIGLPGLNGFAGEFLLLLGMFQRAWTEMLATGEVQYLVIAVLAVAGVVLGAWYMLYLVQRVFFGPVRHPQPDPKEPPVRDLSAREVMALVPLVVFIVWIGVQPKFFLDRMSPALEKPVNAVESRLRLRSEPPQPTAHRTITRVD